MKILPPPYLHFNIFKTTIYVLRQFDKMWWRFLNNNKYHFLPKNKFNPFYKYKIFTTTHRNIFNNVAVFHVAVIR